MPDMAGPYLKEWRKFRHLTQDQVVDRLATLEDPLIPQTTASLSRLENGRQPYSQRSLEALAWVYGCDAEDLIGCDPFKEGKLIDLVRVLDERKQRQAMALLKALAESDDETGTTG